jgi:ribosomal protein S18 acetylase RimI-like enzyme
MASKDDKVLMAQIPGIFLKLTTQHSHCLFVSVNDEVHIMDVWTDEAFRGQGEATKLIKAAVSMAQATGHKVVVLHTEEDNEAMQKVAAKAGLKIIATEVHMERSIPNE